MPLCIRIQKYGGPEALQAAEVSVGEPGAGDVRLRHTAIGLNFIDTYHRSGLYPLQLPSGIGLEAAGVVEAVGPGVDFLEPGDRVAYAGGPPGAYAEVRLMPAAKLLKLPPEIADETAAALLLKGMTAYFLLHQTFAVKPGHRVLIHAAAGGVGSVLVPWARHLGATVIGTAGGAEKCQLATRYGCHHAVDYTRADFVAEVKRLTGGEGVEVVYDAVGRDTFLGSLDCLRRRGMMVTFGNASGKPPPIEPNLLAAKGSLFLTRPSLMDYTATRAELETCAEGLFAAIRDGVVKADVRQRYPLREAARAHADLQARRTSGTTLLVP